jgi:hypothetical protein
MTSLWLHSGAFVIQLQPDADVRSGRFEARVEHVATGQSTHIHSSDELLIFLDRVLRTVASQENETLS